MEVHRSVGSTLALEGVVSSILIRIRRPVCLSVAFDLLVQEIASPADVEQNVEEEGHDVGKPRHGLDETATNPDRRIVRGVN